MIQLWSFEWCALNGEGRWHPKAQSWKTPQGAVNAAYKWQRDMSAEDCRVDVRLVELVPDGKGGRIARVVRDI